MQFWSVCLGNLFEHYDTALFGFLSPFLAPLFFPKQDPLTALILTYAIIPLGMLMRPLGALFFGYIGDLHGRHKALFVSLLGMGLISFCLALMPTFEQIGVCAPLLFCLARLMQNFLASGEIMGGAILLLEGAQEKQHDILSSLYAASTIGGILLASLGVSCLCQLTSVEVGWRFLYIIGGITAFFGCIIRGKERMSVSQKMRQPLLESGKILWHYRKIVGLIAACAGFSYAGYSVALVVINGLIPLVTSVTKEQVMQLNTALLVLDFVALPLFGWISSKISREKLMISASLCVLLTALPLFLLLEKSTWITIVAVRVCFVFIGVAFFAPFHAWSQRLVPEGHRYLVISFGYALGSQLLGSPTSAISLWIFKQTGMITSVAWYWMALALATFLGILRANNNAEQKIYSKVSIKVVYKGKELK